jgi:hypothetical protein
VQGKQAARDTLSPGSQPETQQALRHTARNNKHARIILPRNHSSGRNLPKMARQQAVVAQDTAQRQHGRNRSHENDTEIRLPGSLDESSPAQLQVQREQQRPAMRRNMTAVNLSRNASHTKLKKNLSHGQLQRLNSRGNLAAMGQSSVRAPPSPGLKGKNKRPKSADAGKWALEKDLHEQEVELALRIAEKKARGPKKVGFAVGSSGDSTGGEEAIEDMEDAGMEEGEWTEESTSASPYSTRQNTANNSRRTSSAQERVTDRALMAAATAKIVNEAPHLVKVEAAEQGPRPVVREEENVAKVAGEDEEEEEQEDDEDTATEEDDEVDDPPKSRSQIFDPKTTNQDLSLPATQPRQEPPQQHMQLPQQQIQPPPQQPQQTQQAQQPQKLSQAPRSPLHGAKEHPNPTIPLLRNISTNHPPPAMTSNVNAMDNSHSTDGSPAASTMSARSTLAGDGDQDELVSRFIPSTSHPGSNPVTTQNTPKSAQFHTPPVGDSVRNSENRHRSHSNQTGDAVSPGNSTKSGSSGTATPSIGRSRIELKMLQEKAMAEIHSVVDRNPFIPAHVYDRRNESLKSYLNLAALNNTNTPIPAATTTNTLANSSNLSLGPEIFQGRFKAVHTELRVVQKFRDPLAESVARLRACKGSKLSLRSSPQKLHAAALRTSKSAISLPASAAAANKGKVGGGLHSRAVSGAAAEKALSGSPVKGGPVGGGQQQLQGSKSSVNVQQQGQQQQQMQMQMQQGRRMQGQRGVSFAGAGDLVSGSGQNGEDGGSEEAGSGAVGPEVLARKLWAEIGSGSGGL